MKNHILLLGLIIITAPLFAQESGSVTKLKKADRVIFEVFHDIWQDVPSDITLKTIQPGFGFTSMQDFPIGNSNFAIAFGFGISSHNMHTNGFFSYDTTKVTEFLPLPNDLNYKINKFTLTYLETPAEIRFRTKGVNTFRFYAGIKLRVLLQEHTKYRGDDPFSDYEIKFKEYKHKHVTVFSFAPTVRVGYKWFNIYASYGLSPVFEKNKGPQMYPISVGLSIIPY
jgi:hypothetical protein